MLLIIMNYFWCCCCCCCWSWWRCWWIVGDCTLHVVGDVSMVYVRLHAYTYVYSYHTQGRWVKPEWTVVSPYPLSTCTPSCQSTCHRGHTLQTHTHIYMYIISTHTHTDAHIYLNTATMFKVCPSIHSRYDTQHKSLVICWQCMIWYRHTCICERRVGCCCCCYCVLCCVRLKWPVARRRLTLGPEFALECVGTSHADTRTCASRRAHQYCTPAGS